jgi:small GTP-binding protein
MVTQLEETANKHLWLGGLAFHPTDPTILATLGERDTIISIWELDYDTIRANAPKQKPVRYTTARIALVGDSGVGKTGLGWRLAHGEFKEHPSSHGQQFWVIKELGAMRKDGTECEAVLWDLAGQPDYRLVHALFLDDVDAALVLFDPANRQEPLKGVEYWLKQLAHRRERSPGILLVGARADRGAPTLTPEELDAFCRQNGIAGGYISTSAKENIGLDELMARIRAAIDWDAMPATVTSVTTATFECVKEYVLGLKADTERKGVIVGPRELRARLEANDANWVFSDAEMMTAAGHLANHGHVTILRGSSGEQTILLAPDLLVNLAASIVLEARRNPRGLGALEEVRLLSGGYDFPELVGLEKRERDVLLDATVALFLTHNVCFRETSLGGKTFLVFPELNNHKRPQIDEVATIDDVSYEVSGVVENVYAALVVLLGYTNTFTRTNQWQNQAQYETAGGDVCGFRQIADREGEIELVLYYGAKTTGARLLFQGLFEQFLNGRDVTVTRFPPVACPKCKYRQERGEVVRRIREGRGFLFCGECGKKIVLPKAGEQIVLSQADRAQVAHEQERTRARTTFETALVRVKALVRDQRRIPKTPSCFVSYAWGVPEHERWVRGLATDLANAGIDVILDRKDNAQIGASVARFISEIERSDYVAVVATPLYRQKYENKLSSTGSVVAAEVDLINLRLTATEEQKNTVLPLLLAGQEAAALPPLARGRVYADFRDDSLYFAALFDLILTLYRIRVDHPAIADLREALWQDARRRL